MEISDKFKEMMENDSDDDGSEQVQEEFICCVCRDLLYKPVVLACGHTSCFWCIHKSMSGLRKSHCPLCRNQYYHFPSICQTLHLLLLKMYPVAYNKREKQVLEDEKVMGFFSPQFNLPANQQQPEEAMFQPTGTLQSCISEADLSLNPCSIRTPETLEMIELVETDSVHLEMSNLQIHGEDVVATSVITVEDKYSSPIYPSGTWKQVSAGDVLCGACLCVLFRPVVLNCGHVFCVSCIVLQTNEVIKCEVCQSPHPGDILNVCVEFDHFLEEHFPQEYGLRRGVQMKQEQLPSETSSACSSAADKKSFCFSNSSKEDHLQWWNASTRVHIGVGCDSCGMYPIIGDRYRCQDCLEEIGYDLCKDCYSTHSKLPGRFNQQHTPDHKFEIVKSNAMHNIMLRLLRGQFPEVSAVSEALRDVSEALRDVSEDSVNTILSLSDDNNTSDDAENNGDAPLILSGTEENQSNNQRSHECL